MVARSLVDVLELIFHFVAINTIRSECQLIPVPLQLTVSNLLVRPFFSLSFTSKSDANSSTIYMHMPPHQTRTDSLPYFDSSIWSSVLSWISWQTMLSCVEIQNSAYVQIYFIVFCFSFCTWESSILQIFFSLSDQMENKFFSLLNFLAK